MRNALFSGTFDPPTLGHESIIKKASYLFDRLYVGLALNPEKKTYLYTLEQRKEFLDLICSSFKNVEVVQFSGLVIESAKKLGVQCLIRGLRGGGDFENELQMAFANKSMGQIETVFLTSEVCYSRISSRLVREFASRKMDLTGLIPAALVKAIAQHQ